jgi:hypothetical protein
MMTRSVAPRSMKHADIRAERRAMLSLPHVAPLRDFAIALRERLGVEVPDFDPADGGTGASLLFLLEKPGPMTSADRTGRVGSGFISLDNDDPTAEAAFGFMKQAGIPRHKVVMWNVIPGWNGTRKITSAELKAGVGEVSALIQRLPAVGGIVLVGNKARRAEPLLRRTGLHLFHSLHPSPLVRASRPAEWAEIPVRWRRAAGVVLPASMAQRQ